MPEISIGGTPSTVGVQETKPTTEVLPTTVGTLAKVEKPTTAAANDHL
jgi:hypothetical protein